MIIPNQKKRIKLLKEQIDFAEANNFSKEYILNLKNQLNEIKNYNQHKFLIGVK